MKGRGILIGALFALAFLVYFLARPPRLHDEGGGGIGPLVPGLEGIPGRIALRNDSLDTNLILEGTEWRTEGSVRDRADSMIVHDLIELIRAARILRVVEPAPKSLSTFGLEPPKGDLRIGEDRRILIGDTNPTGDGMYALCPPSRSVFLADRSVGALLSLNLRHLRDRTVLRFPPGDLERVTVRRNGTTRTVDRAGRNRWTITELGVRADARSLAGLVALLSGRGVHSFQDSPAIDFAGSGEAFGIGWRGRQADLLIGAAVPGTSLRACLASDREAPFRLPRYYVDSLFARSDRLTDLRVFEASALSARSVSVRTSETSFEFVRREEGGWVLRMEEDLPSDRPRVRAFLRNLDLLVAADVLSPGGGLGGWVPSCRVAVDSEQVELGAAGETVLARRLGETGFLRLPSSARVLLRTRAADFLKTP